MNQPIVAEGARIRLGAPSDSGFPTTRVLVIADDPITQADIAARLNRIESVEIIGKATSGIAFSRVVEVFDPDVIVRDASRAGIHRLDDDDALAVERMPAVVALVPRTGDASIALKLGASAILPRDVDPAQLGSAIEAVLHGLLVLHPAFGEIAIPTSAEERDRLEALLTPREREVMQLLAEGLPNKLIATTLDISEHTAKFHVNAILTKLGAHSRTEAVTRAARSGLIDL